MIEPDFLRATRAAYDLAAVPYTEFNSTVFPTLTFDHAMIAVFADVVRAAGGGPVADLGCGPGHVTAQLHDRGLPAFGVDLSPELIALARRAHPELRFEVGSMGALDLADGSLAGILARYSIIHTPPERLPEIFAEFGRVLAPGGHLLVSFQAHEDPAGPAEMFDHKVTPAYRWPPDRIAGLLREAGIAEVARLVSAPEEDAQRGFPQAHLLARRRAG
ncbi:class I SAM-dependent methyltransferase [Nonomuraea sp. NPDC003754]